MSFKLNIIVVSALKATIYGKVLLDTFKRQSYQQCPDCPFKGECYTVAVRIFEEWNNCVRNYNLIINVSAKENNGKLKT